MATQIKTNEEHHWVKEARLSNIDKGLLKTLVQPCKDFNEELLVLSQLPKTSASYILLYEVLTQFLHFKTETSKSKQNASNKLQAVVGGSFAAYLGKAVKQYDDVDVFVLVSDSSMTLFTHLWNVLQGENSVNLHVISDAYDRLVFNDILTVVNFGKVQLVFRYYPCVCGCDYHVNKTVFENFHHCTRWKLDVFDNCIMPRYIPLEDKGIICKETSLTLQYEKVVVRNLWNMCFETATFPKKYPNKHLDNVVNFAPPSLKQQSLHAFLRMKEEKKGKRYNLRRFCNIPGCSKIIHEEMKIDVEFLECAEEFKEDVCL